jgi:hypothetical protein
MSVPPTKLDKRRGEFLQTLQDQWLGGGRGRSMERLLKGIGVTHTRWGDWKKGQGISPRFRCKLCKFFGVSELDLVTGGTSNDVTRQHVDEFIVVTNALARYEAKHSTVFSTTHRATLIRLIFQLPAEKRTAEKILAILEGNSE